jgi:hypothetical protein
MTSHASSVSVSTEDGTVAGREAVGGLDAQLTQERHELKYLVPARTLPALVSLFDQHISAHRFHGEGSNPLPFAQHFITTVYLDTPSRAHYRLAADNAEHNVKVRAREYYDVHPSLAELATSPEQILHHQPWIWFEIKRREGSRTLKRRARVAKRDVPKLFPGAHSAGIREAGPSSGTSHSGALEDIAEYCRSLGEPLAPACLANYQRLSWQSSQDPLRVTLDLNVAFFSPTADLWQRDQVLTRDRLGPQRGCTSEGVLELKYRGDLPHWLTSALEQRGLKPGRHSKFTLASKAVHGD